MRFSIWENFPHIGLMDNIKNPLGIDSHQDKATVSKVERIDQSIHLTN